MDVQLATDEASATDPEVLEALRLELGVSSPVDYQIIRALGTRAVLTRPEIEHVTKLKRDTVLNHLKGLLRKGCVRRGESRGTAYTLTERTRALLRPLDLDRN